ncbi:MAG TPA: response regulator [Candidatus Binataceae bacterium]|nr:response regulator [Candidatus Binataceae bacterium]
MPVRVLIADGSGITREIIRHHLECIGCRVVAEAQTVSQTLDLFHTVAPQVVTLNGGLGRVGDLDVFSVFRRIRREAPETSVIIVSPGDSAGAAHAFTGEGALACIVEPIDSNGFERMWRSLSRAYPELHRVDQHPAYSRRMRTTGI